MNQSGVRYCQPNELPCGVNAQTVFSNKKNKNCDCPEPCNDRVYSTAISMSSITDQAYENFVIKHGKTISYWKKNIVHVLVYFSDLIEENVTHKEAFRLMGLLCNVGGVFGLILGASLVTLVEILDICVIKLFSVSSKCKKNDKVTTLPPTK